MDKLSAYRISFVVGIALLLLTLCGLVEQRSGKDISGLCVVIGCGPLGIALTGLGLIRLRKKKI